MWPFSSKKAAPPKPEPVHVPKADKSAHWFDGDLFHGTKAEKLDGGKLRATKTKGIGLPEPTGISFATNEKTARQFGHNMHKGKAPGLFGDAELFMKRAREHMAAGDNDDDASAKTQREFREKGYNGVRWGPREVVLFDPDDFKPAPKERKQSGYNLL